MKSKLTRLVFWGWSAALWLLPVRAQADFLIEFLDGHSVTVGRYFEEGSMIKIYTPQGSVGFRKAEVKRILSVDANGIGIPLETASVNRSPASSLVASGETQNKKGGEGKKVAVKKQGVGTAGEEGSAGEDTKITVEELGEKYQGVKQQIAIVWDKYVQDLAQNAPDEVLAESTRQLEALERRRQELINTGRKKNSGEPPDWAR